MSYYAVAKGRNPGIYMTWDECKAQVHQFPGPKFKKFPSRAQAEDFIAANGGSQHSSQPITKTLFESKFQKTESVKRPLPVESVSDSSKNQKRRKTQLIDYKACITSKADIKTDENGFITDENGFVNVYTDGACTQNGKKRAKAGVGVWFADNHPLNVSRPVIGRQTNNMAEIQAVTEAAKQARKAGVRKLKINTDSKFLISCITKWMRKWKATGWKTAAGQPVINKTELLEMEAALAPLEISWNHVRGHVGIHGNEMADKLARNGVDNGDDN